MRCRHLALLGVFLLASVIDVRVKAAKKDAPVSNGHSTRKSLHHSGPVAEPPDCVVGKTFPCAIQVSDKKTGSGRGLTGELNSVRAQLPSSKVLAMSKSFAVS